ncbi:hypothetical protein HDV01_007645 [Terramyces sp. JEL0728]|nr:hypothetical protein HDV01_007645 [Terramyces sp. JEL0728]
MQQAFNEKYELQHQLGTGAFSEVKLGIEKKTGVHFAIKIIDRTKCKGKEDMIETEVKILQRIDHPNIVKLYEMYEFEGKIYLVMELVTGGELFDLIVGRGCFQEKETAEFVKKILLAINYLHDNGIVHRDLKPENLLLSEKSNRAEIKISDFGLSKIFNEVEVMKTACGTPGYVAPEVLKRQGYGNQVDLWSLGVITYILLCGYPPFFDQKNAELFKKIMAGKYQFDHPWWDHISERAKDFVRRLLVVDIKKRYTAKEALNHPFIVYHCGESVATPVPVVPVSLTISPRQSAVDSSKSSKNTASTNSAKEAASNAAPKSEPIPRAAPIPQPREVERIPEPKPLESKPKDDAAVASNETVCTRSTEVLSSKAAIREPSASKRFSNKKKKISVVAQVIKTIFNFNFLMDESQPLVSQPSRSGPKRYNFIYVVGMAVTAAIALTIYFTKPSVQYTVPTTIFNPPQQGRIPEFPNMNLSLYNLAQMQSVIDFEIDQVVVTCTGDIKCAIAVEEWEGSGIKMDYLIQSLELIGANNLKISAEVQSNAGLITGRIAEYDELLVRSDAGNIDLDLVPGYKGGNSDTYVYCDAGVIDNRVFGFEGFYDVESVVGGVLVSVFGKSIHKPYGVISGEISDSKSLYKSQISAGPNTVHFYK